MDKASAFLRKIDLVPNDILLTNRNTEGELILSVRKAGEEVPAFQRVLGDCHTVAAIPVGSDLTELRIFDGDTRTDTLALSNSDIVTVSVKNEASPGILTFARNVRTNSSLYVCGDNS